VITRSSGTDSFEFDYAPGYTKPTHEYGVEFGTSSNDPAVRELLVSMVGYRQRGITLAGGQGDATLATGCALAKKASDGKYCVYTAGQTDGHQNCLGSCATPATPAAPAPPAATLRPTAWGTWSTPAR